MWFVTAAAVAVLVVGFVLHSVLRDPGTIEQQIGHQVYDASGNHCFTRVTANEQVARRWPQASKAEIIVCETSANDSYPNFIMDFAQFGSATALSKALKTAPPNHDYCTIGSSLVTRDDLRDEFAAMCAKRGGTLHAAHPA